MSKLEQLHEIAESSMSGLTAGPELKARILEKAGGAKPVRSRPSWVPALCVAAALLMVIGTGAVIRSRSSSPMIVAGTFGDTPVVNERASVNDRSLGISNINTATSQASLWAESSGVFPMIAVHGRYYRMLNLTGAFESLAGSSLGAVAEFTANPALSGSDTLLSNTVPVGTPVYGVAGMETTLVTAEVNGTVRLFQRVSYNNSAKLGRESLKDTLQISGHVVSVTLTGSGTVEGAAANALADTLIGNASYESAGSISARRYLIIALDNGCAVQLAVKDEDVAACGVWSCPEFFEAFDQAVNP